MESSDLVYEPVMQYSVCALDRGALAGLHPQKLIVQHEFEISAMDFDYSETNMVFCDAEGLISYVKMREEISEDTLNSDKYGCDIIKFMNDSMHIVHSSSKVDDKIRLMNLDKYCYVRYFQLHQAKVLSISSSPALPHFFSSSSKDRSVVFWDDRDKLPIAALDAGVYPLATLNDEFEVLATCNQAGEVSLFDIRKCYSEGPFSRSVIKKANPNEIWTSIQFSPNKKFLLICTDGSEIRLISTKSGIEGHRNNAKLKLDASYASNSTTVISGSEDGKLYLWDVKVSPDSTNCVQVFPMLCYPGPHDNACSRVLCGKRAFHVVTASKEAYNSVFFSIIKFAMESSDLVHEPVLQYSVCGLERGALAGLHPQKLLVQHDFEISSMDFDYSEANMVFCDAEGLISYVNMREKIKVDPMNCQKYGCGILKFLDDSVHIVHSSSKVDDKIRLMNLDKYCYVRYFHLHQAKVLSISSSPVLRHFFTSSSKDRSVVFWDDRDNLPIAALEAGVHPLATLNDEFEVLATCNQAGEVSLFDIRKCYSEGPFSRSVIKKANPNEIWTSIQFSPNKKFLLICTDGSEIRLISTKSGIEVAKLIGYRNNAKLKLDASYASNSTIVISGSQDGKLYLWDVKVSPDSTNCVQVLPMLSYPGPDGSVCSRVLCGKKAFHVITASKEAWFWGIS
ncbi:WD repeat-containing protein 82-A [Trichinella zimbabwensis]|uniref:WD repeat-containing protein 82-A n=1 Tax=Trichinella zimbabwensis TaxID=268475 RepID=A0A0V1HYY4_9BILA|nr:WD repeat-containing protein 82-A [Trichinella zimbabwensis]